jgi:predicted phage terminase large subunit-like protein
MDEIRDIDVIKTWVLSSTLNFTRYFFKQLYKRKFVVGRHHVRIAQALDRVFKGESTRLIINIAPRFGKTELAVKNFIAMGLALNPRAKFIHLSYSDGLARDNSRGVQEIIRDDAYLRLFPSTRPTSRNTQKWTTTEGGGLYAVSSAGQVTGFGAGLVDLEEDDDAALLHEVEELTAVNSGTFGGAIVIDDPIKPDDARSELIRTKVNQKFETTIRNRVNSRNTPIIIIMQRLDVDDLCGYLQRVEPEAWEVLSLPVLEQQDGRDVALWPFKMDLEEIYKIRELTPWIFETQYMQNPMPLTGLMYERPFKTYDTLPVTRRHTIKSYTDTADTGEDFLCSIVYVDTEIGNFVLDVLYTNAPMETTEPETARMHTKHGVQKAVVESNNGGRGFAREVEKLCRLMGNATTAFTWFAQTKNKAVRIFSHSAEVQNLTYFPTGWEHRWPAFWSALTHYKKEGKNAHDDAPDCLTGTVEKRGDQPQNLAKFF